MGSLNTVCGISRMNIHHGEEVYFSFISSNEHSTRSGGCYPFEYYNFLTPLIKSTYNAYGSVDLLDDIIENGYTNIEPQTEYYLNNLFSKCINNKMEPLEFKDIPELFSRRDTAGLGSRTYKIVDGKYVKDGYKSERIFLWIVSKDIVDELIKAYSYKLDDYSIATLRSFCGYFTDEYKSLSEIPNKYFKLPYMVSSPMTNTQCGVGTAFRQVNLNDMFEEDKYKTYTEKYQKGMLKDVTKLYFLAEAINNANVVLLPFSAFGHQCGDKEEELKWLKIYYNVAQKAQYKFQESMDGDIDDWEQKYFEFMWDMDRNFVDIDEHSC